SPSSEWRLVRAFRARCEDPCHGCIRCAIRRTHQAYRAQVLVVPMEAITRRCDDEEAPSVQPGTQRSRLMHVPCPRTPFADRELPPPHSHAHAGHARETTMTHTIAVVRFHLAGGVRVALRTLPLVMGAALFVAGSAPTPYAFVRSIARAVGTSANGGWAAAIG